MSRVEDLSAELAAPELFRDLCASIASVAKKCIVTTKASSEETSGLTISALGAANSMQLWVQLAPSNLFCEFTVTNSESIELEAGALAHALPSESTLLAVTEIRLRITHKLSRQPSSVDSRSGNVHALTPSHRLLSFHSSDKDIHGQTTRVVEQRIYADFVPQEAVPEEPVIAGIRDYADPTGSQLAQMAKTSDQYRHVSDRVRLSVLAHGALVMKAESGDAVLTTVWEVDKAERVGGSQEPSQPEPSHEEGEGLFVNEEAAAEAVAEATEAGAACVVAVRDWQIVLQARKLCRRMVLGILHHRCVVVYGFLKQGRHTSAQDVVTFYLWHQS